MQIQPLIDSRSRILDGNPKTAPIVITSRIRLARNLRDCPFPGWAKESHRREILARCRKALEALPQMDNATFYAVDELTELERQVLVERHLASRELAQGQPGAGILISEDQATAVMINEEDHLRIQMVRNGFLFKTLWNAIDRFDSSLEEHLDFAFSRELGYLTACPTNVGTGLRASVMLHLPGLVMANQMEKVIRAVNQLGIIVRGLFGEGSDASGSVFQISNQQTLGESEEAIIRRLGNVLKTVIEQESNARARLLEKEPIKVIDKIGRAYGILQNGHLLSSSESMNFLSLVRLGVDIGLWEESVRSEVDRLFVESQPGHVQFAARNSLESGVRDRDRARLLRREFRDLPPCNFDKLSLPE
jgi:protein arginine kinase